MIEADVNPDEVAEALERFAAQMMDLRPWFATEGRRLGRQALRKNFDSEGEWGGWAWPEWSPSYSAARPPGSLLVLSGALRSRVMNPRQKVAAQSITLTVPPRPEGGVDLTEIHHFGAPRANIPPRPLVPYTIPGDAVDEIRRSFEDHADKIAREVGLA